MTGSTKRLCAVWMGRALVLVAVGAVIWTYCWIVRPAISQLDNKTAKEAHYNLLADGFLAGQLNLKREAAPELARVKNPYDPAQNGPYRLHDASYYRGKLYLYFGITPALVLFVPYTLLTGHYLWHNEAVAILCSAGFLIAVGLLGAAWRRYFPTVGTGVMFLATLALGLANGVPVLLRRPDVWEIPIATASALAMLTLAGLWGALHANRGTAKAVWLACASLTYGLAVGARPSVLPGAVILLVPVVQAWAAAGKTGSRRRDWRLLVGAAAPIATVGIGLVLYNWLRFASPSEFGQHYQMAADDQNKLRHFGLDFLWFNFRVYFLAPMHWASYFPFVRGITVPPVPPGQFGIENPFGVLTNVPLVWLAACAPLAWFRRAALAKTLLQSWLLAVLLLFATCALTIGCFGGACNRYEVEFLPALVLLAIIGIFSLDRALEMRRWARGFARLGWGALLLFSIAFNFFASCEHWGLLRVRDPVGFSRIARVCDEPAAWLEKIRGIRPGPLELRLVLPPFTTRRLESLLVTGYGGYADYVWIEYIDGEHARIGIEHTGYGGPISAPLALDYGREHTVVLEIASLYPPKEHPFHRKLDERAEAEVASLVRVEVDDREVLRGKVSAYDASPLTRWVGINPFAQNMGTAFSGRIVAQRTLGPVPEMQLRSPGPARIKLWFPHDRTAGVQEPLVVTGATGAGDVLFVRYVDDRHVAFGFDHWNVGGPLGPPVEVDFAVAHRLDVHMGSLYPPGLNPPANAGLQRRLEVKLDGAVALSGDFDFYPAKTSGVYFGQNAIGASTATGRFTGRIVELQRGP